MSDEIKDENENENDDLFNLEVDEENLEDEGDAIVEEKHEDTEFDIMFKGTANKHKLEGTHALKRDTILMGKLEEETEEEQQTSFSDYDNENYDIEKGSVYEYETRNYEEYYYRQELTKDINHILAEKTELDFKENRRKPSIETFNKYYDMCVTDLETKYTKSEILVELSYYFTDNIFNMYKLLSKKNATGIIFELKDKGYLADISNINFI